METAPFLEQLFLGSIDPQCRESPYPKAMRKAQQTFSNLEQTPTDQLPTPQRELSVQYTDAREILDASSDLGYFVCGSRLGAQMALDTFKNG